MMRLSQQLSKKLLAIHGWSGVLLGMLLYVVLCTGSLAVFGDEIADWSSPLDRPASHALPNNLNQLLQELLPQVDEQHHHRIVAFNDHGGRLYLRFENPERDTLEYQIDPLTQHIQQRRHADIDSIRAQREAGALAQFFVDLHVRLHLPNPWGIFLTGLLGLAMMIAAITGLLTHRHLLSEAFTLRSHKAALISRRDAHVVAGSWSLPFVFLVAFTGSFFSFASSVGLPAMALVVFEGNQDKAMDALFNRPQSHNGQIAPLANVDAMVRDAAIRGEAPARLIDIRFAGRSDARARVFTDVPQDKLRRRSFDYHAASGDFLQENPVLVGKTPSAGNAAATLMEPLHFGNFAGIISRALWFALGFAAAYVTFSGLRLWLTRRQDEAAWAPFVPLVHWLGYGLPLCLLSASHGFFIARLLTLEATPVMWWSFGLCALACLLLVVCYSPDSLRRPVLRCMAVGLLALPLLRWLSGGPGWINAAETGLLNVIAIDALLLLAACLCWRRSPSQVTVATMPVTNPLPASES